MPLRQTDKRKSDEPEGWGWEQQPATREENHHYRVSGLVQHDLSHYKAATSPLAKRNTRCVKHLAPASSRQQVLKKELGWLEGVERAKKPARLPVVFTREEARAVLSRLDGVRWMMASLLYGSGCGSWSVLGCASRMWTSTATSSSSGTVRERQGPCHYAPGSACRALEDAPGEGPRAPQEGPLGGLRGRVPALRVGEEVSEREP